jgi:CubicO group peptidase (beta-lactamase class C family)
MLKVLKWVGIAMGGLIGVVVLAVGILVAWKWTLVKNMTSMETRGVEILEGYQPLRQVIGLATPTTIPKAPQTELNIAPEALARAKSYSDSEGGMALLVYYKGALQYEAYAQGFDGNSRFETFSMHKSVLGLLYGAALRDGAIASIDDPIGEYIDEWKDDPRGKIPLRAFLEMQSGLKVYSMAKGELPALELAIGDRISETALSLPIETPPFETFKYYNANSQIAGIALDRALKKAGKGGYAEYLSTALWQPIGAGTTNLWIERKDSDARYFAGLQGTPYDWMKVGMLIADNGIANNKEVLPASWIETMATPSKVNPNYGIQVWLGNPWKAERAYSPDIALKVPHKEAYRVDDIVFFDGFGGQRVYVSRKLGLVIVRIGKVSMKFDDSVIPNAVIDGISSIGP